MIYTLTISPSLDFVNEVKDFAINKINRRYDSIYLPGGKGINVSIVLEELGVESIAIGYKAGFTGEYLKKLLDKKCIKNDLIDASGYTRINVKIISEKETALNTNTLIIEDKHISILKEKIKLLQDNDFLIISGNIPSALNQDLYEQLIKDLNVKVKVVIDAESKLLMNTLKYNPYLIKPNREELEDLFNIKIESINDVLTYAKVLQNMGARNVIVSLDKEGALLLDETKKHYYLKSIDRKIVSSVGAGDSLIAGFICGVERKYNMEDAFMLGMACASATAFSKSIADKASINQTLSLLKEINN